MSKPDDGGPKEGWQAEKHPHQRRYHYIRDTMALCRKLAFYTGDLMPFKPGVPKSSEDCAECFKLASKHNNAALKEKEVQE